MTKGALMASAAAALILAGGVVARAEGEKTAGTVACAGINACKGQGACAGGGHACAGKNGCKGQGWVEKNSAADCTKAGGKVVEMPKK
jgi:hypothetical protein